MPANKTCPRCGARFQCFHSADCWCATISLNEKARRELATRYHDCLCQECLTAIAAGSSVDTGVTGALGDTSGPSDAGHPHR